VVVVFTVFMNFIKRGSLFIHIINIPLEVMLEIEKLTIRLKDGL